MSRGVNVTITEKIPSFEDWADQICISVEHPPKSWPKLMGWKSAIALALHDAYHRGRADGIASRVKYKTGVVVETIDGSYGKIIQAIETATWTEHQYTCSVKYQLQNTSHFFVKETEIKRVIAQREGDTPELC